MSEIQPKMFEGLPRCDEACPSHDGKRCRLTGFRPNAFCEPQLKNDRQRLAVFRAALGEVVHAADEMLAGGERAIQHAERCTECGHGGEGPLKDALKKARGLVPSRS